MYLRHMISLALALALPAHAGNVSYDGALRPQVHFSPPSGFMNDPNGMFYDPKREIYHFYYQYNPSQPVAGNQHWGHATSKDLYHWTNQPIALSPDSPDHLIFSGSAVTDPNNTSGFFPNQDDGVVAIYTVHSPTKEDQHIAYSTDGGYTFTKFAGNPVINSTSKNFRDPQVTWHAGSNAWVLAVAYAEDLVIAFYTSPDLKDWTHVSNFTQEGLPGDQFECPNLVRFSVPESGEEKDVLFISVNPGAPLGGSGTFYLVGEFNGTHFVSETQKEILYDFVKDNYASQWFSGLPAGRDPVSIGWASNWDYTNEVPTGQKEGWRSAASLPVSHKLVRGDDGWTVTRVPFGDAQAVKGRQLAEQRVLRNGGTASVGFANVSSNAVYFDVHLQGLDVVKPAGEVTFNFTSSSSGEFLDGGVFLDEGLFWVNRAGTHLFTVEDNESFTAEFNATVEVQDGSFGFEGAIDRSVFEVFLQEGRDSGTVSFFPEAPLDTMVVAADGIGDEASVVVDVWALKSGWRS